MLRDGIPARAAGGSQRDCLVLPQVAHHRALGEVGDGQQLLRKGEARPLVAWRGGWQQGTHSLRMGRMRWSGLVEQQQQQGAAGISKAKQARMRRVSEGCSALPGAPCARDG